MSPRVSRRKSKATTAENDEENPEESHTLNVTIPEDIEEDTLINLLPLLPDINLAALTSDDVVSIYRLLLSQTSSLDATEREHDETRAELERKEVELDQALQDKESLAKDLETSVESVHEELTQVKQERDQLGEHTSKAHMLGAEPLHVLSGGKDRITNTNFSALQLTIFILDGS